MKQRLESYDSKADLESVSSNLLGKINNFNAEVGDLYGSGQNQDSSKLAKGKKKNGNDGELKDNSIGKKLSQSLNEVNKKSQKKSSKNERKAADEEQQVSSGDKITNKQYQDLLQKLNHTESELKDLKDQLHHQKSSKHQKKSKLS